MKNRLTFYPRIRRGFGSVRELSEVINRSESYCKKRLNGKEEFTQKEKNLIASYLHIDVEEVVA